MMTVVTINQVFLRVSDLFNVHLVDDLSRFRFSSADQWLVQNYLHSGRV